MEIDIKQGLCAKAETVVQMKDTAKTMESGLLVVLATPRLIALMEKAAYTAVQPLLPEGYSTVGIHISVSHLAATPVGVKVWVKATLVEIEGKKLMFNIEAYDERDKIGEARHERFVIEEDRFLKKAYAKVKKQ